MICEEEKADFTNISGNEKIFRLQENVTGVRIVNNKRGTIKMETQLEFRYAERKDVSLVLYFIKGIAKYEKMEDQVEADEKTLEEWMFDKQKAECIFACLDGKEIGFALFFHNFSTFVGRAGLYREDIFILPEYRGKGYGKQIFKKLASIAVERHCGRMEWVCLDWNKPSIEFYTSLGAVPMTGWTTYRLSEDKFRKLAEK